MGHLDDPSTWNQQAFAEAPQAIREMYDRVQREGVYQPYEKTGTVEGGEESGAGSGGGVGDAAGT